MIRQDKQKLVVIGNGMAGGPPVEENLGRNPLMFDNTLIGGEPHGNSTRILPPNILNGPQDPSDISLNPIEWYAQTQVRLLPRTRVTGIARAAHTIILPDGRSLPYDKLVIATGSRPFIPPIPGTTY